VIGSIDIQETRQDLAHRVAEWLTVTALAATGPFRVALSGGSTPEALYSLLASEAFRERFPWARASWYLGDERFLPYDHPESNYGMITRAMFSRVPAPAQSIHPVPVDGSSEEAALRYERTLQATYGAAILDPARPLFDVCLLGLGADGHTASLIPAEPALDERRRWVVAVPHGRPEVRITMTYPVLESCRRAAFLVAGADKAAILRSIRAGHSDVPAARLKPLGEVSWFMDKAAAG
jgi:6-phosphogluconolactonase